jgi:type I restriction enzyme S subunit
VGEIKRFPVPIAPLEEQEEIVRRVEALFSLADAIEKRVALATQRVEKTTHAILAKAFRGELVPTEAELARRDRRPYKPASVLLERIRFKKRQESVRREIRCAQRRKYTK